MKQVLNAAVALTLLFVINTTSYSQGNSKVSNGQVKQIISAWSAKPKEVANAMINKYGNPQEATSNMLIWYNKWSLEENHFIQRRNSTRFSEAAHRSITAVY